MDYQASLNDIMTEVSGARALSCDHLYQLLCATGVLSFMNLRILHLTMCMDGSGHFRGRGELGYKDDHILGDKDLLYKLCDW